MFKKKIKMKLKIVKIMMKKMRKLRKGKTVIRQIMKIWNMKEKSLNQ